MTSFICSKASLNPNAHDWVGCPSRSRTSRYVTRASFTRVRRSWTSVVIGSVGCAARSVASVSRAQVDGSRASVARRSCAGQLVAWVGRSRASVALEPVGRRPAWVRCASPADPRTTEARNRNSGSGGQNSSSIEISYLEQDSSVFIKQF